MKKIIVLFVIILTLTSCGVKNSEKETSLSSSEKNLLESSENNEEIKNEEKNEDYILIELGDTINVDGEEIKNDITEKVFLQNKVETHPDVTEKHKNTENKVITISDSGIYKITGNLENGQIMVDTASLEDVEIILDNVSITNYTAPAIYILNANEKDTVGDGSVTIYLNENSVNNINGANIAKETDSSTVKNDGAISTNVSLVIDGPGELNVTGSKEGIETKMHLTINNGKLNIEAHDDSINASEDNVSHITINGGYIYAKSTLGEEGDGIDSNGYITINDGTVIAVGHVNSMDSGLDSDLGIIINGGTIAATGNMYDSISDDSSQHFINLSFSETKKAGTLLVILDENNIPILAYEAFVDYSNITLSNEKLIEGKYKIYLNGSIVGEISDGLYNNIISYENGDLQQYTGLNNGRGRGPGDENKPPEGENKPPEGENKPPEGENKPPEGENKPPEGELGGENNNIDVASSSFEITSSQHVFSGVSNN